MVKLNGDEGWDLRAAGDEGDGRDMVQAGNV
jgi:hypothetical protein